MSHPVIAMCAGKGGAGKTALSLALSAEAVARGLRVFLGDADPRGVSLRWARTAVQFKQPAPIARGLDKSLAPLIRRQRADYDLQIIDTAGAVDERLGAALAVADLVLCPVKPETSDIIVLAETLRVVRDAMAERRKPAQVHLVLCCADRSRVARRAAAALAQAEYPSLATILRRSCEYTAAQEDGRGITTKYPRSDFASELRALLDELLDLTGGAAHAA